MARVLVLILGLIVLVVGAVNLVAFSVPSPMARATVSRSFAVEPGESLRVESLNGRITYETWGGDELFIEATHNKPRFLVGWFERLWGEPTVTFTRDEQGVRAGVSVPKIWWFGPWWGVHFTVRVPAGWHGNIVLSTSNGAIAARGIDGDVLLSTSNGSVEVAGHRGTLEVRTSNGRVRLADVHGVVSVRTSNGPITVAGATLSGIGQLRTSNGSVELRAHLAAGASYDVTTSNGTVTLTLIDPDAALDLRTSNGSINLQTEIVASSVGRNSVVGTIGSGAARLNVRTSNGAVTLAAVKGE